MSITLKAARVNSGLTQAKFAAELGVTIPTLRAYERGKSFPDVPKLKKIEQLTGVGYDDLIFLDTVPVKPEKERQHS